jgi:hypothetical protein
MSNSDWQPRLFGAILLAALSVQTSIGQAQEQSTTIHPEKQINWALASFFGTGWYRVDDNRSTFILHLPFTHQISTPDWLGPGSRNVKMNLRLPVSLGFHRLDDIPDLLEFDNYASLTFVPGIEFEIPVTQRWTLKPLAHFGVGYEQQSDEAVIVWYGGIRNRFYLQKSATTSIALLGAIAFAGSNPEYEARSRYASLMGGVEGENPLPQMGSMSKPFNLYWHATYSSLFDEIDFHISPNQFNSIDDQWEFGVGLGKVGKPISLWMFTFDRLGVAYQRSTDGQFEAIKISVTSPFDL